MHTFVEVIGSKNLTPPQSIPDKGRRATASLTRAISLSLTNSESLRFVLLKLVPHPTYLQGFLAVLEVFDLAVPQREPQIIFSILINNCI
jgi:hypothetical protein